MAFYEYFLTMPARWPIINKREFEKMIKKVLLVIALIIVMFSSISCQTVQGLGGDIKWTGEKVAEMLE